MFYNMSKATENKDCRIQTLRRKEIFQCPLCPAKYHVNMNLIQHVEIKHSKTPKFFALECSKCLKLFSQKHNQDQRQAVCPTCKPFECLQNETIRLFKCRKCQNAYTKRDNLISHTRRFHPKTELTNSVPVSAAASYYETNPKFFRCSKCPEAYSVLGKLKEHQRSKNHGDHDNSKPMVTIPHYAFLKECKVVLQRLPNALIESLINESSMNHTMPDNEEDWSLIWNPDSSSEDDDGVASSLPTSEHGTLSEDT